MITLFIKNRSLMVKIFRIEQWTDIMLQKTFLVFSVFGYALASRHDPFYRKDYTYIEQFDAFYKIHWDLSGFSWGSAFLACDDEEAALFYPKLKDEWTVLKSLVSSMKVKPNVSEIFVGIHDEYGLGEFITVDGLPTPSPLLVKEQTAPDGQNSCVTMDIETGAYKLDSCIDENLKPFVCKKKIEGKSCPTVDSGYTVVPQMKKCYKVNQRKKSWSAAMQTCYMEGGILAVIQNSAEANVLHDKIGNTEEEYFVGIRRMFPNGDFYTVKGQKFDDTVYQRWYNRMRDETTLDCGVIVRRGDGVFTSTSNCLNPMPFICEMSTDT